MAATLDSFDSLITREEKAKSYRFWRASDLIRHRVTGRTGEVMAVYDQWVWVRWDDAGRLKGCWQPDTEFGSELEFVGERCRLCGKTMGNEIGTVHGECSDRENADNY